MLPQHLSTNSEVRARFEREAKTVSSLNHPNICVLHDVGREGDTDFLVMELIDGETLADRIARGPLPPADLLKIGAQIADALDRAHRAGVIHRDLKPGNIMLTGSGAKLMDFGLARATGLAGAPGSGVSMAGLTQSPTIAQPLTAEGSIVGTFQYMAPEQLEGKETDVRSDIWALGCVLYEMATGVRAFEGKSQASLIATIMHTQPKSLSELVPANPAALDRLIRECLVKDPEERRQSAGDIRLALNRIARGEVDEPRAAATGARRPWVVAIALVCALGVVGGYLSGKRGGAPADQGSVSFTIAPPPGNRFRFTIEEDGTRIAPPVISPDGKKIIFGMVNEKGERMLVARSLDDETLRPIDGTAEARFPFFSRDGSSIGFFADGKLRTVALAGGAPMTLAGSSLSPRGADWGRDDTILYAPTANSGIFAVPAGGGTPVQVTFPDTTLPDISHRYPTFLPDNEHFVFLVWTNNTAIRDSIGGLYLGSIRSHETKRFESAPTNVVCVGKEIYFARDGNLYRGALDVGKAKLNNILAMNQQVDWDPSTGRALFDVSRNGTMVCREKSALSSTRLVWFDRRGAPLDTVGAPANYRQLTVARDGRSAAASIGNETSHSGRSAGDGDIWLIDFNRGLSSRFTNSVADEGDPTLSADGRMVAFSSDVDGPYHAFVGPADRSQPPRKVSPPSDDWVLMDWSKDGRYILLENSTHIWVVDYQTGESHKWQQVSGSLVSSGCFSPDSRWIAYTSQESGRDEIYVRAYPGPGGQWQVSLAGGLRPHWSTDGSEIVYRNPDGELMAVPVDARDGFKVGVPKRLFRVGAMTSWAASGDNQRFLVTVRNANAIAPPLKVVTNWTRHIAR